MAFRDRLNLIRKALSINLPTTGHLSLWGLMPRTQYDYEKEAGSGRQSAIIMACVRWVERTFPEAPIILQRQVEDGEWEMQKEHPVLDLLESPNAFYDGLLLQSATVADLMLTGNAYWLKVRSGGGRTVELWWVPSMMVTPKWPQDGSKFVSHYDYSPGYKTMEVAVENVVHFRAGFDPDNIRKGLSPLKSLFREVFTDDEAANMTGTLLRNLGVPGVVISPEQMTGSVEDVQATKEWFKQHFTGDYRGEPLVMSGPTKIQPFTFSPQQMDLKALRRIPEERVAAVFGVPAVVVGLGAGLDRSTYSNMAEARESAYESTIIPMQRAFASVLKRQLLVDFEDDVAGWRVGYDLSAVKILQEDENALVDRTNKMVLGGYLKVMDAQRMTGAPVDDTQDYYLRPFNVVPTPSVSQPMALLEAPTAKTQFKALTPQGRESHWRQYAFKAENHERLMVKELRQMFEGQESDTLKRVAEGNRDTPFHRSAAVAQYKALAEPILRLLMAEAVSDAAALVSPHKALKQGGMLQAAALAWLRTRIGWAAEQVGEETAGLLAHTLGEGYAAGEGIPQLSKRIKAVFDFCNDYRAERIARTETIQASAQGAIYGYEEAGVRQLEFYAALDERACEDCMALHEQRFPIGEAEGIITVHPNCRCIWIPVVE